MYARDGKELIAANRELRAILAQPAEAEVVADLEPILEAVAREYGMGGLSDGLYADYACDVAKRYASAALSAVTAERDQSISLTADYIAMLGEAVLELDQLRAVIGDPLRGLREAWAFWRACKADLTSQGTGARSDNWLTDELHQLFETGPYEKSPQ